MIGQVGIDQPDESIFVIDEDNFTEQLISNTGYQHLNPPLARQYAQSINTSDTYACDGVQLWLRKQNTPLGNIRVTFETDSGGDPSNTQENSSDWISVATGVGAAAWVEFQFESIQTIVPSTVYHFVVEFDAGYVATAGAADYVEVGVNNTNAYAGGGLKFWDGAVWADIAGQDMEFVVGLQYSTTRRYKFTYYNSTHAIESQDSDYLNMYLAQAGGLWEGAKITIPARASIPDTQATHVRIYRNEVNGSTYYLLGQAAIGAATSIFWDVVDDTSLSVQLQSTDHRRFSDSDDNLLVPRYLEQWQGRIHAVADNDNTDYFSKKLEGVGSLGVAGDSIYDYFPADNNWNLDSEIRAIRKRGEDELVVYTSDNDIHVFRGGNSPLNPPPDLAHQPMFIGENCADSRSLVSIGAHHIYVTSNNNIRAFSGGIDEQVTAEELGTAIKTSMDAIGSVYSAAIYDNQYVLAVDADDDGVLDTLYIIDLSQRIPAWREAVYYDNASAQLDLYHIHVTRAGVMLACPADLDSSDFHVIQLDSGTSDDWVTTADDGVDITQTIQTQFIIPARRARWNKMILTGLYPSTANIPTLTMTATDKSSNTSARALEPTGSEDVRGHTSGVKLFSEECAITITSVGARADEIRGIYLQWAFN
jgi:hypothetical protein